MKTLNLKPISLLLIALLFVGACKKVEDEVPGEIPDDDLSFREVLSSGGDFSSPNNSQAVTATDTTTEIIDNTIWECVTETQSIEAAGGGDSGFPMFSPNSNVIYPGNLLQGSSLNQGTPDIIVVKRAGGTISTDVLDGNIASSFEVDEISKATVTDAINNIIAGSSGVVPANFSLKIESIQSREQFALSLGVDVNSTFADLEATLGYNSQSEKNTFMVNLQQSFYTMSFDIPTSLDELFDPSVKPEDLEPYVGPNNPATYISDVTYGRVYFMMIESSSSAEDMEASINSSFNGVGTDVEVDIETSYMSELENLEITVFAYGGESGSSFLTVGNSDISELAELLAKGSVIEAGKPISYVVRSVANNQIVSTQLATSYDVTNCEIAGVTGTLPAIAQWTGQVLDKIGSVAAAYSDGNNQFVLMNEQGQWIRSSFNNGEARIEGPFELEGLPFNGVGAACKTYGENGSLLIIDPSGTQHVYLSNSGNWSNINPISSLGFYGGDCPFGAIGVGAIASGKIVEVAPTNQNTGFNQYFFNTAGDKYSKGFNNSVWSNHFGQVYDLYQWGEDYSVTDKIEGVGAAIGFTIGFGSSAEHFNILFNEAGTKYVVYGNINGDDPTEVAGPFAL